MLNVGVLPHHKRWGDVLANLDWIVLDEAHTYRGVFGSHVANVMRRLRRVVADLRGAAPFHLDVGDDRQPARSSRSGSSASPSPWSTPTVPRGRGGGSGSGTRR